MVSVNEAVTLGLSLCPGTGLEDLPTLCRGGETISLLRLFHYFRYHNNTNPDNNNTDGGDCQSGERPDPAGRGCEQAMAGSLGAGSGQDGRISEGEGSTSGAAVSSRGTPEKSALLPFMMSKFLEHYTLR